MPAVLEARCNQCEYVVGVSQSATFLVLEDGSEEVLPHPIETLRAKTRTGKSLDELNKAGRLRYRYGMICRSCGEFDFYANPRAKTAGHIGSIVGSIAPEDGGGMKCVKCGAMGLQCAMGEQIGCLPLIFGKRPKPNAFACPRCKKGVVTVATIGRS